MERTQCERVDVVMSVVQGTFGAALSTNFGRKGVRPTRLLLTQDLGHVLVGRLSLSLTVARFLKEHVPDDRVR